MAKFDLEIIVKLRNEAQKALGDLNTGLVGLGKGAAAAAAGGVAAIGAGLVNISNVASDARTTLQGLNDVDLTAVIDDAQLLARRYGADTQGVIKATRTLMEEFGVTSAEATDIIAAGFANGLDVSGDFLDSIGEYSNLFADGGASAAQMLSLIESGLAGGVLGTDKAADAFKEFGIRIRELPEKDKLIYNDDGTLKEIQSEFNNILIELGLTQEKADELRAGMEDGSVSMADMFNVVIGPLGNMEDKLRQNYIGIQLFGTQWEDLGPQAMTALTMANDSMEMLGATANTERTTIASLGEVPAMIFDKFSLALLPVNDILMGVINEIIQSEDPLAAMVNEIAYLIPGLEGFADKGAEVSAMLQPFIQLVKDNLVPILISLGAVIGVALVAAFVAIAAPIAKIVLVTSLFVSAMFAAVMAAQRVWQAFTTRFPQAQDTVTRVMTTVKSTIDSVMAAVSEMISITLAGIQQFWTENGDAIMDVAKTTFDNISAVIENSMKFIRQVVDAILKLFRGDWQGAFDAIKDAAKTFIEGIELQFKAIVDAIGPILQNLSEKISDALTYIWENGDEILNNIKDAIGQAFTDAITALGPILTNLGNAIEQAFTDAWNNLGPTLNDIKDAIGKAFTDAWNNLGPTLNNIKNAIERAFVDAVAALARPLQDIYNSVVNAFANVQRWLSGSDADLDASKSAETAVSSLDDWLTGRNGLIKTSEEAFENLQTWLNDVVQDAAPIAESVVTSLTEWWNDANTGLIAYTRTAFNSLQRWLTNLNLSASEIAKSIVTSLSNMLTGTAGLIGGAVQGAFNGLSTWLSGRSESGTSVGTSIVTSLGGKLSSPVDGLTKAASDGFKGLTTWLSSRIEDGAAPANAIISSMKTRLSSEADGLIRAATDGFNALSAWLLTSLVTVVQLGPGGAAAANAIIAGLRDRLTSMVDGLIPVTQLAFEDMRAYIAGTVSTSMQQTTEGVGMNMMRNMVIGINANAPSVFDAVVRPYIDGLNAIRAHQGLPLMQIPIYTPGTPLPPVGANPGTIPLPGPQPPFGPGSGAGIVINIGSVRDQRDIDAIERAVTRGMSEAARRGIVQSQLPRGI